MARPGNLDQRVTLQEATTASDGGGGTTETWGDFATVPDVWANVVPASGGERNDDGSFNASGAWVFTIRNRSDVTERDRIMWGSEPYNIRQVKRAGNREMYLKIIAERGVAQ